MTLEAVMLHHLDDLDAKINGIKQFLKTDLPDGSNWSAYHRLFDQSFYSPGPWEEAELPDKGDQGSSDS
jgi:3'-5' exoribonuclease